MLKCKNKLIIEFGLEQRARSEVNPGDGNVEVVELIFRVMYLLDIVSYRWY